MCHCANTVPTIILDHYGHLGKCHTLCFYYTPLLGGHPIYWSHCTIIAISGPFMYIDMYLVATCYGVDTTPVYDDGGQQRFHFGSGSWLVIVASNVIFIVIFMFYSGEKYTIFLNF